MSLTPLTVTESEQLITIEDLLRSISMPLSTRERPLRTERVNVAHVADFQRRYPGEPVSFFTRVQAREDLDGFNLEILIPDSIQVKEASILGGQLRVQPGLFKIEHGTYIVWKIEQRIETGSEFEFRADCVVGQREDNVNVLSRALVSTRSQEHGDALEDEETASIFIAVQARYMRYLPALYAQDRVMNRFLMMFESFWEPIQQQISGLDHYFDPSVTPPDFLPWLSSWIALPTGQEEEAPPTDQESVVPHSAQMMDGSHLLPPPSSSSAASLLLPDRSPSQDHADVETGGLGSEFGAADFGSDFGAGFGLEGDLTDLGADGDSTGMAQIPGRKPWQARQVHLPSPANVVGSTAIMPVIQATRSSREPLILPSSAENARKLLKVAQQLHKRRGTRRGLQQYLEIYTDTEVHVIEHRAENFVLTERGALGSRVALGLNNHPHSFTVILRFYVKAQKLAQLADKVVDERTAAIRRRVIPIIEEQKPAHTTYQLEIDVVSI